MTVVIERSTAVVAAPLAQPIGFLRAHLVQRLETPDERLQLADLARGGRPHAGLLGRTEARDQRRIRAIGLGPTELTRRKRMDHHRIHHADAMARVVEPGCQRVAVRARGFETGMDVRHAVTSQPRLQLAKARRGIRAALAPHAAVGPCNATSNFALAMSIPSTASIGHSLTWRRARSALYIQAQLETERPSIPYDRTPQTERRPLISVTGSHGLRRKPACRRSYSGAPEYTACLQRSQAVTTTYKTQR